MNNDFNMEEGILTLTLDDDTELQCYVIGIFPAGEYEYIALDPIDNDEYAEALVYRYSEAEDGEMVLENIESDEEYEIVADAFDELLDTMEFYDMGGEELEEVDDDEEQKMKKRK